MSELKPCPFCGGVANLIRKGDIRKSMIVDCDDCGAEVECSAIEISHSRWNNRHNDSHWLPIDTLTKDPVEGDYWIYARDSFSKKMTVFLGEYDHYDWWDGDNNLRDITHVMPIHKPEPPKGDSDE